jgi:hypothetical protein
MPTTNGAILPIQQPQTMIAMTGTSIQQGHNYPPNTNAMQNRSVRIFKTLLINGTSQNTENHKVYVRTSGYCHFC